MAFVLLFWILLVLAVYAYHIHEVTRGAPGIPPENGGVFIEVTARGVAKFLEYLSLRIIGLLDTMEEVRRGNRPEGARRPCPFLLLLRSLAVEAMNFFNGLVNYLTEPYTEPATPEMPAASEAPQLLPGPSVIGARPSKEAPPNAFSCPICLRDYKELGSTKAQIMALSCGHLLCGRCLISLRNQALPSCPVCRREIRLTGSTQPRPIYL